MRWRCALLQRWLPEYPDGNLPAFWKRRLTAHLEGCPHCRQEWAAWGEVVEAFKAQPVADPGPEFWEEFSREMHLKLVQATFAEPAPRRFRLPYYLLGAPAVAVLLLWLGAHIMESRSPVPALGPQVAQKAPEPAVSAGKLGLAPPPAPKMAKTKAPEQVQAVSLDVKKKTAPASPSVAELEEEVLGPEEGLGIWDPDPVLSELTDQEREILLQRLRAKEKDGSCATLSSPVS